MRFYGRGWLNYSYGDGMQNIVAGEKRYGTEFLRDESREPVGISVGCFNDAKDFIVRILG